MTNHRVRPLRPVDSKHARPYCKAMFTACAMLIMTAGQINYVFAQDKPRLIGPEKSKIVLDLDNVERQQTAHFYLGATPDFAIERYGVFYTNRQDGRYARFILSILSPGYYWQSASKIDMSAIKQIAYFKEKTIRLGKFSPGLNAGTDTAAGGSNYLLFEADGQPCAYLRRIANFGDVEASLQGYSISGIYCARHAESLTEEQALEVINSKVVYVPRPDG